MGPAQVQDYFLRVLNMMVFLLATRRRREGAWQLCPIMTLGKGEVMNFLKVFIWGFLILCSLFPSFSSSFLPLFLHTHIHTHRCISTCMYTYIFLVIYMHVYVYMAINILSAIKYRANEQLIYHKWPKIS